MATVPVIRYKNRTGKDNPVSGGLQAIPVQFSTVATGTTYAYQWKPPAGMNFEILGIDARATVIGSDPSLTVGLSAAGTQVVAAVNLTTQLGALTLKSTSVTPGSTLDVRLVADAGDSASNVSITIVGYCSVPPDSAFLRGTGHF